MWLLDLWRGYRDVPRPRSFEQIRRDIERGPDGVHLRRLNRVEESLFELTAEAGLEDLKRRLERHRDD